MKTIDIPQSLKTVLKRLRLSGILPTLPGRIAYGRKSKITELDLIELVLQDEIDRRDQKSLSNRLSKAGFEDEQTFEGFNWETEVTFDRDRVRDLLGLGFIERAEDIIFMGPVGVGKTFLAAALGHAACRAGHTVSFLRADQLLRVLQQSRADLSTQREMRNLLAPDLLIVDDFGLRRLDPQQSSDIYELIIERHRRSSTIFTSNRTVDEWIPLFDDPLLAQSAIDRFAHNAYQVQMEGPSYRDRQRPDRRAPGEDAPPDSPRLPPRKKNKR
jgi:DNA replication protein DnaC